MSNVNILAAERIVDGQGSVAGCRALEARLESLGIAPRHLVIDPLRVDWHSPLAEHHFRSGCAPLEALAQARDMILEERCEAVVISGCDPLASGYDRAERHRRMAIYGPDWPLTQAYDALTQRFLERFEIPPALYRRCRDALFANYRRTYLEREGEGARLPSDRWYAPVSPLFRGVDCANPVVDFEGRVLLVNDRLRALLGPLERPSLTLSAVGLGLLDADGPTAIEAISRFDHLTAAVTACQAQAGLELAPRLARGDLLLEVYSCYPVIPLAFLLTSGLADSPRELPAVLARLPVTVSGGMNLARAPWNNPALNALAMLCEQLWQGRGAGAVLHGNGGLGYRQGVALIRVPGKAL